MLRVIMWLRIVYDEKNYNFYTNTLWEIMFSGWSVLWLRSRYLENIVIIYYYYIALFYLIIGQVWFHPERGMVVIELLYFSKS